MAENTVISGYIHETGDSVFAVEIEVQGHKILGDEPVTSGGKNLGPSPYDLLLAALGECTAMTIRWYARRHDWPLDKVEVRMTHSRREVAGTSQMGGKIDVFTKEILLTGDKLTQEQRDKLMDIAAKCPVQRTLLSTPVIQTRVANH